MTTIIVSRVTSGYSLTFRGGNFSPCVSTLKEFIHAYSRSYEPTTRKWCIDEDAYAQLFQWLDYAHAELGARVEWQTSSDRKREKPPEPPPPPPRQKASDPFAVLHLRETAPDFLIRAVYKCLSRQLHPDAGGSHEEMVKLNAAYARLAQGQKAA
jgi:hypothetical protein